MVRDNVLALAAFFLLSGPASLTAAKYFDEECKKILAPLLKESDQDGDGIHDACEQRLAERYAPVIYHSSDESNFPTNVDAFLAQTALWFYHYAKPELTRPVLEHPTQQQLLNHQQTINSPALTVRSDATRSKNKLVSFYLADVPENARKGSTNAAQWTTYFHAYTNELGGITIQFWRFYAYNDAFNNHGGDWEGIHIILDQSLNPEAIALLGHVNMDPHPYGSVRIEGNHPVIFSEGGGHGSRLSGDGIDARGCSGLFTVPPFCKMTLDNPKTFVRQETWTGGKVTWFDGRTETTGPLVNIGEKSRPLNGQVFIRYSGLWGAPSKFFSPLPPGNKPYFGFSGYWGPAFNETGMAGGFIRAWADGMAGLDTEIEGRPESESP
jgi:hypothetical protein